MKDFNCGYCGSIDIDEYEVPLYETGDPPIIEHRAKCRNCGKDMLLWEEH